MASFYTGTPESTVLSLVSHHLLLCMAQLSMRAHEAYLNSAGQPKHLPAVIAEVNMQVKAHVTTGLHHICDALSHTQNGASDGLDATLNNLHTVQQKNKQLVRTLNALVPSNALPELSHVIDMLLPLDRNTYKGRTVLLENPTAALEWSLESIIHEQLPAQYRDMPTQWMVSMQASLLLQADSIKPQLADGLVASLGPVLPHFFGIRSLGVSYYSELVLHAMRNSQHVFLAKFEPLFFQALNYFNTASPHSVRLHGLVDSTIKSTLGADRINEVQTDINVDDIQNVFCLIETTLPDDRAFTSRNQSAAEQLLKRLQAGLPPCALQQHDTDEVWDRLHALGLTEESIEDPDYEALHEQGAIYQLIAQTYETPVHVRDMLAAAWLQRLEDAPKDMEWLINEAKTPETLWDAWQNYWPTVQTKQQRFIKAIETAQLHQAIMGHRKTVSASAGIVNTPRMPEQQPDMLPSLV